MTPTCPARLAAAGALAALLLALPAAAEPRTTSDLLLPYFEVDLDGARTTLFAVGNESDKAVRARVTIDTNWGIPVLARTISLDPREVKTINLKAWIVDGDVPGPNLGPAELAHLQAALSGAPSPEDGLYYSSEVEPDLAVGSLTVRIIANNRPDVLWGDYFWVDAEGNFAEGELLVDIDKAQECRALCDHHLLRFLEGGAFDGGTQIIVWVDRASIPRPSARPELSSTSISGSIFYDEPGNQFDERMIDLLAAQAIPVRDLLLDEPFGWLRMITEDLVYVGVRYTADNRFGVTIQSWCVEEPVEPPRRRRNPGIDIEKSTNGFDADQPVGPFLQIGAQVVWEYRVTNTGNTRVEGIVVSDNQGVAVSCPRSALNPGQAMTCTASGVVEEGPYANIGTVQGIDVDGTPVSDNDPSHYFGQPQTQTGDPAISLEKLTNGVDADDPSGPNVPVGNPVQWTYIVVNAGGVELTNVSLSDDQEGAISCPKTVLGLGESMTCTASGVATLGQYANLATVTADSSEGPVDDTDPSHYFGVPPEDDPGIKIEKATNGIDADSIAAAPVLTEGDPVTWTYVVTNTGNTVLSDVEVTDDQGVEVSCPKTTLEPGESMTCQASGVAVVQDECYCNVGIVVGVPPEGDDVTDSDPSHYCAEPGGEVNPAIDIEKLTNDVQSDVAPGETLIVGSNVQWEYEVTNTGNVKLTGVTVSDDQGVSVTCPKTMLEPGEMMTCTANGTAEEGQYANIGTATGTPLGGTSPNDDVSDTDPSHYFGELPPPGVDIEKATNGFDADDPPGPTLEEGDAVTWTYVVTNTGQLPLTNVTVTDDQGVAVSCPKTSLNVGESMTCTAAGTAEVGQYANVGTVNAGSAGGPVSDSDPSHYFVEEPEECSETCEGKISFFTLEYIGTGCVEVEAVATPEQQFSNPTAFGPEEVCSGDTFDVPGLPSSSGGFDGTLGTNLELRITNGPTETIHTSCSVFVGPGYQSLEQNLFEVVVAESTGTGLLCPVPEA